MIVAKPQVAQSLSREAESRHREWRSWLSAVLNRCAILLRSVQAEVGLGWRPALGQVDEVPQNRYLILRRSRLVVERRE